MLIFLQSDIKRRQTADAEDFASILNVFQNDSFDVEKSPSSTSKSRRQSDGDGNRRLTADTAELANILLEVQQQLEDEEPDNTILTNVMDDSGLKQSLDTPSSDRKVFDN